MQLINSQKELDQLCKQLSQEEVLFIDTEFCRRKTYYAQLSIIQVSSKTDKYIVDALTKIDLAKFGDILSNDKIVKVFHSPDQDFGIFYHLFGKLPANVFDTQIAAGVCGLDDIMGYSRLCKQLLNVEVDKTLQKADWLQRPLSNALLNYAIKDIEYLPALYRELSNNINSRKLWDAYFSRSAKLTDKQTYKVQPGKILDKMRLSDVSKEFQNRLKHLITFREECAQILDIPRGFCASDKDLIHISRVLPTNDLELNKLRIQSSMIVKRNFKVKLFELCAGLKSL